MKKQLLIYGAAGFTGRLVVQEALAFGLPCVLGGRNRDKLAKVARVDGLPYRIAALNDREAVAQMLEGVAVVLNVAGPFHETAMPLAQACIHQGVHYLDINGEFATIEDLKTLDERARAKDVMILPAAGFDVVPSDCLALLVASRLPNARKLSIALRGLNTITRGSASSVFSQLEDLVTVRRGGRLARVAPGELTREFDFGDGPTQTTAVSWADVASAYYTTGIPDITVYYEATPIVRLGLNLSRYGKLFFQTPLGRWWQEAGASALPEGPTSEERARGSADVVVHVEDAAGRSREARLRTPEVYGFTASTVSAIADRVLRGEYEGGFQTPARAYGADFVLSLPGVVYSEPSSRD